MNLTKKLETELENQLFEKVKISARGPDTFVKEGAGIISSGCYLMNKKEVELMIRKKISLEIKLIKKSMEEIKIKGHGSTTIVKEGKFICDGYYLTNVEEVLSMVYKRVCQKYKDMEKYKLII